MTRIEYITERLNMDPVYQKNLLNFLNLIKMMMPVLTFNSETKEFETFVPYDGKDIELVQQKTAEYLKISAALYSMEYDTTIGDIVHLFN